MEQFVLVSLGVDMYDLMIIGGGQMGLRLVYMRRASDLGHYSLALILADRSTGL